MQGLDISVFRHFPFMTLRLSGVVLRDSLWEHHHKDLLQAGEIDVRLSLVRSLFSGQIRIGKVFVEHGRIYFFTDSSGYSNTSVLTRDTGPGGKGGDPPDISFSDVEFVQEKLDKHKLFDLDIRQLEAELQKQGRILKMEIRTEVRAKSFSFNTGKGSFLRNQDIHGNFTLRYNLASKILEGKGAELMIGKNRFVFSGRFFPTVSPDPFSLSIDADHILYRQATALLTPDLQQKLDQYDIDKALAVHVSLDAGSADERVPLIKVRVNLDKGGVLTPLGRFTDVRFQGSFVNEWVHGEERGDRNSAIRFVSFSGSLQNIPVESDTVTITDLKKPILSAGLRSRFFLSSVNELSGSQSLRFSGGNCVLDAFYRGPLSRYDSTPSTLRGYLDLDSAVISYLPYQVTAGGLHGRILFQGRDVAVDHLSFQAGSSKLLLKGSAKNLVSILDNTTEDVTMDWTLRSPRLDVQDLAAIAGHAAETKRGREESSPFGQSSMRLDSLLRNGSIHIRIDAGAMVYQRFNALQTRADLLLTPHEIRLNELHMEQGGGKIEMKGRLSRGGSGNNPLSFRAQLEGVDLPGLFSSFDDFGLQSLRSRNLKGRVTADVELTGLLDERAKLAANSLKGNMELRVEDGQLVDFEPIEQIHNKVLQKRDLSEIRFGELKTGIELDSTTLTIHRMEIQSTALTVFVEGTYDLKRGPDLSLVIPISNLKERKPDVPPPNKGNEANPGLSVRMRARTGEDGKLKLSWDPFRKALKKKAD
jgi:hypothetical protein